MATSRGRLNFTPSSTGTQELRRAYFNNSPNEHTHAAERQSPIKSSESQPSSRQPGLSYSDIPARARAHPTRGSASSSPGRPIAEPSNSNGTLVEDLWGVPVVSISATGALPPDIPKEKNKPQQRRGRGVQGGTRKTRKVLGVFARKPTSIHKDGEQRRTTR